MHLYIEFNNIIIMHTRGKINDHVSNSFSPASSAAVRLFFEFNDDDNDVSSAQKKHKAKVTARGCMMDTRARCNPGEGLCCSNCTRPRPPWPLTVVTDTRCTVYQKNK